MHTKLLPILIFSILVTLTRAREPEHPSLYFNAADVPRIRKLAQSTDWLRARRQEIVEQADRFLSTPTNPRQYIAESLADRRPRVYTGRFAKDRIATLTIAGYLTGDERYLVKARQILLAVVRGFPAEDRSIWAHHLQYSDAARVLAIAYDLLDPYLTPAERAEVRARIRDFGRLLYTDDTTWGTDAPGVTSCNHNAIHFGALGLTALVLGDEPDWLARATERVDAFYANFTDPTGYVTEGHSYLGYGQMGAVPFALALKRSGGGDLFQKHPAASKINDQLVWLQMPFGGNIRTLNDSENQAPSAATMYHALSSGNRVQLWAWVQARARVRTAKSHFDHNDDFDDLFLFVSRDTPLEPETPGAAGWPLGKRYASGRVMLRSAWDDPEAAHVVLTSGYDKHQGHNQQDENSVSFAALGEDFLTDPGYWPDASDCHTTLKINGVEQQFGSRGKILAYREDATGAFVRAQTQEAYPIVPSYVGLAERKLYFVRGPEPYLVWRDDAAIEIGDAAEVVARYVTNKANSISARGDAAVIEGGNHGAKCLLMVFSESQPVPVREDDLSGKSYQANAEMKVVYADHLKRLSATVEKYHARLLTLVMPFRDESALPTPTVHYDQATDTLTCRLSFPQGRTDTLVFGPQDASFERTNE